MAKDAQKVNGLSQKKTPAFEGWGFCYYQIKPVVARLGSKTSTENGIPSCLLVFAQVLT